MSNAGCLCAGPAFLLNTLRNMRADPHAAPSTATIMASADASRLEKLKLATEHRAQAHREWRLANGDKSSTHYKTAMVHFSRAEAATKAAARQEQRFMASAAVTDQVDEAAQNYGDTVAYKQASRQLQRHNKALGGADAVHAVMNDLQQGAEDAQAVRDILYAPASGASAMQDPVVAEMEFEEAMRQGDTPEPTAAPAAVGAAPARTSQPVRAPELARPQSRVPIGEFQ